MGCHVIGSLDGIGAEKMIHWWKSLKTTGFDGGIYMVTRRLSRQSLTQLYDMGLICREAEQSRFQIVVERFAVVAEICRELDPDDWVVACDVTDIVFQRHPMEFLGSVPDDKRIVVSSECIQFQFQWWTATNLIQSFPEHWHSMKDKLFYNAGSIGGRACDLAELSDAIYKMCVLKPDAKGHDQAAMNILLQSDEYRDRTLLSRANDGWCYCIASTVQAKPHERKWLQEPLCRISGPTCITEGGVAPVMFHHYSRDRRLNDLVRAAVDEQYSSRESSSKQAAVQSKVESLRTSLASIKVRVTELIRRQNDNKEGRYEING